MIGDITRRAKEDAQFREFLKKFMSSKTEELVIPDIEGKEDFYFNNNPMIKKAGAMHSYTDLQLAEYYKCSKYPIYFIEKYVKIISIDDGLIPFKLYGYQKMLIKSYQKNRFNISLQARQSGKTATTAAYILWYALFHSDKMIAILANKAAQAREIVSRINTSLETVPFFLQPGNKTLNKGSMQFANRSTILSAATSSSSIRGLSVSLLYCDEFAFIPNDFEFYESTYPVITSGKKSRVILTSTPKGARGLFYKLYKESEEGLNEYVRTKVTWDMVPGRDEEWKQTTMKNMSGEAQFRQEMECEFLSSSDALISANTLERIPLMNPIRKEKGLDIFYEPEPDRHYMVLCDCSRGVGLDYSAFVVVDITNVPYRVVAKYRDNKISPMLYPTVIFNVANEYNEAFVLVEINDIGEQVSNILFYDLEYENLLQCVSGGKKGQTIASGFGANTRLGVRTTMPVKAIGCSNLKTLVEKEKLEVRDLDIIGEMSTFVAKGKSFEADEGAHDDLVMCLVLFAWASAQDYFKELTEADARKRILEDNDNAVMEELMPFGLIDDGTEVVNIMQPVLDSGHFGNGW